MILDNSKALAAGVGSGVSGKHVRAVLSSALSLVSSKLPVSSKSCDLLEVSDI